MGLSTLVEKLVGKRTEQREAAERSYEQIVRVLADDEGAVDEREVEAVLIASRVPPEQLQDDVALVVRRRRLAADRKAAMEAKREVAKIEGELTDLQGEMARVVKQFEARIAEVVHRRTATELRGVAADACERQLRLTAPKRLHDRMGQIAEERKVIAKRLEAAKEQLHPSGWGGTTAQSSLNEVERVLAVNRANGFADDPANLRRQAEKKMLVEAAQKTIAQCKRQLADLEEEAAAVEKEMLSP